MLASRWPLLSAFGLLALIWHALPGSSVSAASPDAPKLPPAQYKPLPVGTVVKYDNNLLTVIESEGFHSVYRIGARRRVQRYALFGRQGPNAYRFEGAGGGQFETLLDETAKIAFGSIWPLTVGKRVTAQFQQSVRTRTNSDMRDWTHSVDVIGSENLRLAGRNYAVYVVREKLKVSAIAVGAVFFSEWEVTFTRWYDPESGLIIKSRGGEQDFELVSVSFPKGLPKPQIAGAEKTAPVEVATVPAAPTVRPRQKLVGPIAKTVPKVEAARVQPKASRPPAAARPAAPRQPNDIKSDLAKLKQLLDAGLIDRATFDARSRALLDRAFGKVSPPAQVASAPPPKPTPKFDVPENVKFGDYHALVIGINQYQNISGLTTAEADAKAIDKVLRQNYAFKTTLLINPTRREIVDAFDDLRAKLKFKDNLLIYYAGHGWLDDKADQGYWLPADADSNRRSNWVSNATITDTLRSMEAKHVMVVADSCYSGRLVRGTNVSLPSPKYYQKMSRAKARVVITSGGLEPVADNNGSGHSPFTDALLKSLSENNGIIDGNSLFNAIRRPVTVNADQTPQYSDVRRAGHDGGDFLFVRRN